MVGKPAVAKTACAQLATQQLGFNWLALHPVTWDPTDGKGMPATYQDNGRTVCKFLPFDHLVRILEANEKTVVSFEDLGQTPFSVQAALMPIIWDRLICGEKISDKILFCATTNSREDGAGVVGLLEPLKTRFDTIYEIEPSAEDLIAHFIATKKSVKVCAFLRTHPQECHRMPKGTALRSMEPWPNYRTWTSVDKWLSCGESEIDTLAGCVGKATAAQFQAFLELTEKCPDPKEILANPQAVDIPEELGIRHAASIALTHHVTITNWGNALTWLERMDRRFLVSFVVDLVEAQPKFANTSEFRSFAIKNQDIFKR
jgi:hypothetical protein